MANSIDVVSLDNKKDWDKYVGENHAATPYHLFDWRDVIERSYGYKTYSLAAFQHSKDTDPYLVGILPLVHMKDLVFGNRLVSIPYFDHGGIIADSGGGENALIQSALSLADKLKARSVELRQTEAWTITPSENDQNAMPKISEGELTYKGGNDASPAKWYLKTHKVRMVLELPDSSEELMASFKSKLRSQIRRPQKAGFTDKVGGVDLLDDFYEVFSTNMRDLGSPVHSKKFIQSVLHCFSDHAKIVMVYHHREPIAGSVVFKFKQLMANPWASALRRYSKDSPNMLLYWRALVHAIENGCRYFDFGRSTPMEGTYRFKSQWGAKPLPMFWYTLRFGELGTDGAAGEDPVTGKKRAMVEDLWRKMPLSVTRFVGPLIRKHIEL